MEKHKQKKDGNNMVHVLREVRWLAGLLSQITHQSDLCSIPAFRLWWCPEVTWPILVKFSKN